MYSAKSFLHTLVVGAGPALTGRRRTTFRSETENLQHSSPEPAVDFSGMKTDARRSDPTAVIPPSRAFLYTLTENRRESTNSRLRRLPKAGCPFRTPLLVASVGAGSRGRRPQLLLQ